MIFTSYWKSYYVTLDDYIAGTATSIPGLTKAAGEIRVGDHGGGWA